MTIALKVFFQHAAPYRRSQESTNHWAQPNERPRFFDWAIDKLRPVHALVDHGH
jgi:hypothetical protein